MNMILHNVTGFEIVNGDTLEDPQILENGQIRKFDRVLANPPFSQNYSRANMQFTSRFREWCPETGKKADLMFVQHMLASLKPDGHMATVMPHGVLFRGGKEKLIRELLIGDDAVEAVEARSAIKTTLESTPALRCTLAAHFEALEAWWNLARDDFAQLQHARNPAANGAGKMPEVRHQLLDTLKGRLIPLKVLDEFKSAGVFVNWWQQIRFDLKTIVSIGWHHSLIPDDYLTRAFFQAEAEEIESLEAGLGQAQGELAEAVETAREVAAHEPDEGEKVSAAVLKKVLKSLIADLKDSPGESARRELERLREQDQILKDIEERIKQAKASLKDKTAELRLKLQFKRVGAQDYQAETLALIKQVDARLADLDPANKADKKKIKALNKDKTALAKRIAYADALLAQIGGQLSEDEARELILAKLYDIARVELERYLNAEKRNLVSSVENLWDKYDLLGVSGYRNLRILTPREFVDTCIDSSGDL